MHPRHVLCLVGTLSCALMAAAPSSCGGGPPRVTLTIAGNVTTMLPEAAAEFERRHPNVRVEIIDMGEPPGSGAVPSDRAHDVLVGYMATGTSRVDVYEIDVVWLAEFARSGWLLPLDEYFIPAERAEFEKAAVDACMFEGRVWAVPEFTDFGLLFFRTDVLAEAGLESLETWQDLEALDRARQRRAAGDRMRHVYGFQGARYEGLTCNYLEALWGEGGSLVGEDGTPAVDSEPAVAALERLVSSVKTGVAAPWVVDWVETDGEEAFRKGEIAVLRAWPNAWRTMQESENGNVVAGKVGIGLPLRGAGGQAYSTLGGWQFAIARDTPAPREAWELVSFLSDPEQQKQRAIKRGYIPTRPALLADPDVIAANPQFALLERFRGAIRPRPVLPVYREISRILSLHVHRALLGEESPRDALRAAAARIGPLLERRGGAP